MGLLIRLKAGKNSKYQKIYEVKLIIRGGLSFSVLHFQDMKELLYTALEGAPNEESEGPQEIMNYFQTFDERFFLYCDKELQKINTFYSGKLIPCILLNKE